MGSCRFSPVTEAIDNASSPLLHVKTRMHGVGLSVLLSIVPRGQMAVVSRSARLTWPSQTIAGAVCYIAAGVGFSAHSPCIRYNPPACVVPVNRNI